VTNTTTLRIGILAADASYEETRCRARGEAGVGARRDAQLIHSLLRHGKTAAAVRESLEAGGHRIVEISVDDRFLSRLRDAEVDLVFNTYFGPARRQDQAFVAAFMEYAGIPFSGGDAACHFIGLSKPRTKRMLTHAGLPTPRFFLAEGPIDAAASLQVGAFELPLIVKPPAEGEGVGLDDRSVVRTRNELLEAVERITAAFGPPALVEEFMPGREFSVGVLDGKPPRVLPVLETGVAAGGVLTYAARAAGSIAEICPAGLPASESVALGELALQAGHVIGCRDCWRVDFRAGADGAHRILEINTLPGLQPGYSAMMKMASPGGLDHAGIIESILQSFLGRKRANARG
jgi:D-alanine--D-alanine ligase